ncbi:MAG TPA: hypothetical protein PLR83_11000, partial [Pyrinomonadaceae bacterium]|nr:hypothetical protein [Pyrinomonadaceae bacterium]
LKDPSKNDGSPNPLRLTVRVDESGELQLNSQTVDASASLQANLAEIFKDRSASGIFRKDSNEIEKTVFLNIKQPSYSTVKPLDYERIVKLIDAIKSGGSSPIILEIQ